MPKECIDCRFISIDDNALQCDRCGGHRLRFSMLAGMKFRERKSEAAKAKIGVDDRPGWFDRVKQGVSYFVTAQMAAFILLGSAVFSTPDDEVPKKQSLSALLGSVGEVYPAMSAIGAIALPAVAAAAAVVFSLRGVYLAQQLGLFVGPVCALGTLAAYSAMGGFTPIVAWLFAPLLASVLSFVAGVRMTGYVRANDTEKTTIEYKPVDSWEREAKPRFVDLKGANKGNYRKLFIGIGAGATASFLLPMLLAVMSGAAPNEMLMARTVFGWAGVVVAGAFAAAGTKAPIFQGSLAGIIMYLLRHYAHLYLITPEAMLQAVTHLGAGIAGGFAGRAFFPPPRVVRGRQRCESDGVVYVGDELVKNSA